MNQKTTESLQPQLEFPEIVSEGKDITVVSYGSTFNICQQAVKELKKLQYIM